MIRKKISYNPEITRDKVMEICKKELPYEIVTLPPKFTNLFQIQKNNFVGVQVGVKQKEDKIIIELIPGIIKRYIRFLFAIFFIPYLIVYFGPARKLAKEIAEFIENHPELKK